MSTPSIEEAKKAVRAIYPKAETEVDGIGNLYVHSHSMWGRLSGLFGTAQEAWLHAYSRLSPAVSAEVGEKECDEDSVTCPYCLQPVDKCIWKGKHEPSPSLPEQASEAEITIENVIDWDFIPTAAQMKHMQDTCDEIMATEEYKKLFPTPAIATEGEATVNFDIQPAQTGFSCDKCSALITNTSPGICFIRRIPLPYAMICLHSCCLSPNPHEGDRSEILSIANERLKFERWYAANRMQVYMHLDTQLRCAIEDTARESWMESIRQRFAHSAYARGAEQKGGWPKPSGRDWDEDASHENGEYQCKCYNCGCFFTGHKRRVECKVCHLAHLSASEFQRGYAAGSASEAEWRDTAAKLSAQRDQAVNLLEQYHSSHVLHFECSGDDECLLCANTLRFISSTK